MAPILFHKHHILKYFSLRNGPSNWNTYFGNSTAVDNPTFNSCFPNTDSKTSVSRSAGWMSQNGRFPITTQRCSKDVFLKTTVTERLYRSRLSGFTKLSKSYPNIQLKCLSFNTTTCIRSHFICELEETASSMSRSRKVDRNSWKTCNKLK